MNLRDGRDDYPGRGQRCMVWDEDYLYWVFGRWDADAKEFEEAHEGKFRRVRGLVWMPEPDKPDGLSLIMGKALRGA